MTIGGENDLTRLISTYNNLYFDILVMIFDILTLHSLLLTALFGGLIGLERERMIQQTERQAVRRAHPITGRNFAGIRTFILIALFGLVTSAFAVAWGVWILIAALIALAGILTSAHAYSAFRREDGSILTELDAYLVFFVGVLVGQGALSIAATLAVIVSLVSMLRHPLHHFVAVLSDEEFVASAKFAAIAFLVLPMLPDKNYDALIFSTLGLPVSTAIVDFAVFNPYKIWLMVVVISAISFIGYVITKFVGARGIELSGFLGGLYSSTTTGLSLSEKSRQKPGAATIILAAMFFTYAAMVPRVLIELRALNAAFFTIAFVPLAIFFLTTVGVAMFFYRRAQSRPTVVHAVRVDNPFKLTSAIAMVVFVTAVAFLAKLVLLYLDVRAIYLLAIILGMAKMDPLVAALAGAAGMSLGLTEGVIALVLGMLANGAQKIVTLSVFGNTRLIGRWLAGFTVIAVVATGVLWYLE